MRTRSATFLTALTLAFVAGCSDDPTGLDGAWVVVQTFTSGGEIPDGYTVVVNDGARTEFVEATGYLQFELEVGQHTLELADIPGNCAVQLPADPDPDDAENPTTVDLVDGSVEVVNWHVVCDVGETV